MRQPRQNEAKDNPLLVLVIFNAIFKTSSSYFTHSTSLHSIFIMPDLSFPQQDGVSTSISDTPPNHYILKLELFSQLDKHKIDIYTSTVFEAGGYKWKLILHPNGNKTKGITDHISLYLSIAESNTLSPCWEVQAVFRLFLLDQNKDCYLTLQDTAESGRRFHRMKLEWGFDKFIPLAAFKDTAKGYLVDDTCVFGAEIYVHREKLTGKGECLSMVKDAIAFKNTWRIVDFSSVTEECLESNTFTAADHKWKLQLYPRGKGSGVGSYVSLYLTLAEPEKLSPASKVYADFTIRILDQLNRNNYFGSDNYWFSTSNSTRGWPRFVSHVYLNQSTAGLLVKNICLVETEIKVHAVVNSL